MSEHFRHLDLHDFSIAGSPRFHFHSATVPSKSGIPFAMITGHDDQSHAGEFVLRLDLGKQVFLDEVADPALRNSAARLAQFVSGFFAPAL